MNKTIEIILLAVIGGGVSLVLILIGMAGFVFTVGWMCSSYYDEIERKYSRKKLND